MTRLTVALAALLALAACGPKEVDLAVNVVTTGCDPDTDPFTGVNVMEVRITGPGIDPPLSSRAPKGDGRLQIPKIPAGKDRVLEVRGYADDASPRPLSIGRSIPIEIPDVLTSSNQRIDLNIFLRRIDSFSPPVSAATPRDCSTMRTPRAGHTATLMQDGRVFIVGGYRLEVNMQGNSRIALVDTEFFDPNQGTFEQGPGLILQGGTQLPKAFHTATLLRNGQVLIYGGERYGMGPAYTVSPQTSALIFDAEKNGYGTLPPRMAPAPANIARTRHLAIPETSGRVLLVGGQKGSMLQAVAEVEWFDPTTNRVEVVMGESLPRTEMTGAAVQDGGIIVIAGGLDQAANPPVLSNQVNFYKYDGSAFVKAGAPLQMATPRRGAAASPLADDKTVLVMGGFTDVTNPVPTPSAEAIKTGNNTVEQAAATIGDRGDVCTALLQSGNVLAVGGRKIGGASDGTATVVRYDVSKATLTASPTAPLKVPRYLHTCTTMADGSVLVTGGLRDDTGSAPTVLRDAWIYTPIPGE